MNIPPSPKFGDNFNHKYNKSETSQRISNWRTEDETNIWELSGLQDGDMMIYPKRSRNSITDEDTIWPKGVVPYFIQEKDFTKSEVKIIKNGIKKYNKETCIQFRPYLKLDKNWIVIKGNRAGCWSAVGYQGTGGQTVNFQPPACVRIGIVQHELLHTLGFVHQHSSPNRDDFVQINWNNIEDGHERNFKKYNSSFITDYSFAYDYDSLMHYSAKSFSKNGNPTIESLVYNFYIVKFGYSLIFNIFRKKT